MTEVVTIISSIGAAILSGGLVSAIVSVLKAKKENEKLDAEKTNMYTQAATSLLEPLNARIEELEETIDKLENCDSENKIKIQRLERRVKELTTKNNQLINGINVLVNQIRMTGEKPFWVPTDDLCINHDLDNDYDNE